MKFFPTSPHHYAYMFGVLLTIPIWTLSLIWKVWPGVPILSFALYYISMRFFYPNEFKENVEGELI